METPTQGGCQPSGQSWCASLVEASLGMFSLLFLIFVLLDSLTTALGFHVPLWDTLRIAAAVTALSVLRSFLARRLFNRLTTTKAEAT
jgi:hypothetical protein